MTKSAKLSRRTSNSYRPSHQNVSTTNYPMPSYSQFPTRTPHTTPQSSWIPEYPHETPLITEYPHETPWIPEYPYQSPWIPDYHQHPSLGFQPPWIPDYPQNSAPSDNPIHHEDPSEGGININIVVDVDNQADIPKKDSSGDCCSGFCTCCNTTCSGFCTCIRHLKYLMWICVLLVVLAIIFMIYLIFKKVSSVMGQFSSAFSWVGKLFTGKLFGN